MSVDINLNNVQETLVSGTNIKTLNGNSLLGAGDLTISSANRSTANTTVTGNRAHNFASFREQWDNIQQFKLTANIAPPLGEASFRFRGFGSGTGDKLNSLFDGNGGLVFQNRGDGQVIAKTINGIPTYAFIEAMQSGLSRSPSNGDVNILVDGNILVGATLAGNRVDFMNNASSGGALHLNNKRFAHVVTATAIQYSTGYNETFIDKNIVFCNTSGGVSVGAGIIATARMDIAAGTSAFAPLRLNAGVNRTTPQNGAFEFDGTNLYFTVGGVRKTVTLT